MKHSRPQPAGLAVAYRAKPKRPRRPFGPRERRAMAFFCTQLLCMGINLAVLLLRATTDHVSGFWTVWLSVWLVIGANFAYPNWLIIWDWLRSGDE